MKILKMAVTVGRENYVVVGVEDPTTGEVAAGIRGTGPMPQTTIIAASADEAADLRKSGHNPLDIVMTTAAEDCRRACADAARPPLP